MSTDLNALISYSRPPSASNYVKPKPVMEKSIDSTDTCDT